MIFVLKLILTPFLIGGVTLAGRKWGPAVSGWLIGLPLTSGPVAMFIALEQGRSFAAHFALGTMMGIMSSAVFCVAYAWLSLRLNWFACWIGGWCVFSIATLLLNQVSLPLLPTYLIVVSVLLITLFLSPRASDQATKTVPLPRWDLAGRMVVATSFVLLLTGLASLLGSHLIGLLSPLPIFATIASSFTFYYYGAKAARQTVRGVIIGSFSFATFFLVVAALIVPWGLLASFSLALLITLCIQGCSLWIIRKVPAFR